MPGPHRIGADASPLGGIGPNCRSVWRDNVSFRFQAALDSLKALICLPKIVQDWLLLSYLRANSGGTRRLDPVRDGALRATPISVFASPCVAGAFAGRAAHPVPFLNLVFTRVVND
jgi:hypothetical protein